ncbi:MAG: glycoside hydrolase [Fibrobacter sp.]|nr:glycoside hydrolase [Fibrobacter sp.]
MSKGTKTVVAKTSAKKTEVEKKSAAKCAAPKAAAPKAAKSAAEKKTAAKSAAPKAAAPKAAKPVAEKKTAAKKPAAPKAVKKVTVALEADCPLATTVSVAGSFNSWIVDVDMLKKDKKSGLWKIKLELIPGEYEYKFVCDGKNWDEGANKVIKV